MHVRTAAAGRRFLVALAALSAAAAVAGLATFGTFVATTQTSTAVSAGNVTIALGAAGTAGNRLTVAATGLVPGNTVSRAVTLSNTGDQGLTGVTLTTTAPTSSVLDTDATNGLRLVIDACSVPWTESGTSPAFSYTCSGTATPVLASRRVIGANLALSNLRSTTAGGVDHLLVRMALPLASATTTQGRSSTIAFTFTGTARPATDR